jgi:two-component system chemotaxis sensor kinase CheA
MSDEPLANESLISENSLHKNASDTSSDVPLANQEMSKEEQSHPVLSGQGLSDQLSNLMEEVSTGNLEGRIVNIDQSDAFHDMAWRFNQLLDKTETLMRETESAMLLHGQGDGERRIDLRGLQGSFRRTGELLNTALETSQLQRLEVEKGRRSLQILLDNLGQGFMVMDEKGYILPGASSVTESFFGRSPEGLHLKDVLQLNEKACASVDDWIGMLFEEMLPFEDLVELGPSTYEKDPKRFVQLDYRPIRRDNNSIENIIVIATDKTEEMALAKKAEEEGDYARMVVTILKDKSSFVDFVAEVRNIFGQLEADLSSDTAPDIGHVFRQMHSLKGGAASFAITRVRDMAHDIEGELDGLRQRDDQKAFLESLPTLREKVQVLRDVFESFLKSQEDVIGTFDEDAVSEKTVPMSKIIGLAQKMKMELGTSSPLFKSYISAFILTPFHECFEKFEKVVTGLAERQGKKVELKIEACSKKVYVKPYKALLSACVHAFRNAVDHGLETPEERMESGKEALGHVVVRFEHSDDANIQGRVKVIIEDDGRGMNPDRIAALAVEKGLISSEEVPSLSAEDKIQFVLQPGFSTKQEVSDVSGRGVGLDAVRYEAKRIGGQVWVESESGKGSRLVMLLPILQNKSGAVPKNSMDKYGVVLGVDIVDQQHQKLFSWIQDLENYQGLEKTDMSRDILGRLQDYAKVHFSEESQLMESIAYQRRDEHVQAHQAFAEKITAMVDALDQDPSDESFDDLLSFLKSWLVDHIDKEDRWLCEELSKAQDNEDEGMNRC